MLNQGVASVERALKILSVFQRGERAITLAEIARRTAFYKSTILRLTKTLCEYGFLIRLSDGTYRLGSTLLHLGSLYKDSFGLEEVIIPALTELVRTTGETASFYIRQGDRRIVLFRIDSPEVLREHILPGQSSPIDETATGQVFKLMAADDLPQESCFPIFTEGLIDPLTASCAAPLITANGVFLGSIVVSGPTARFRAKLKTVREKLIEATNKLSIQLSGAYPDDSDAHVTPKRH